MKEITKKDERSCKNCSHYSQHYSKQGTSIDNVCCGHCLHKEVKKNNKRPWELCEYWENIKIAKEARKQSISEAIIAMSKKLDEIALILIDE